MNDLDEFIEIIKNQIDRITPDTDTTYSGFDDPEELIHSLKTDLIELENGNMEMLREFYSHFLPTATFQELSLQNGWAEEYIDISERIDELYMRLKPLKKIDKSKKENLLKRLLKKILN